MRRLSLVIGVLIVGLVLCRGSVPIVYAADFILSGDSGCAAIGIWNATTNTCTLNRNIHGSIEIKNNDITIDGNGFAVIGSGIGTGNGIAVFGLYLNVTIKNVAVSGWSTGIWMYRAYYTTIANATITNNGVGISLLDSPSVTLSSNTIQGNATGISAGNSFDGLTMRSNALESNGQQIQFTFINNHAPNLSIDTSNTMNGKPIYYFENENGTMHENLGEIGALYCFLCTNVTFDGFSINGGDGPNGVGLTLYNSHDNTIRNGTFAGVKAGVNLAGRDGSERNIFTENTFYIVNLTPQMGRAVGAALGLSNDNLFLENNFLEPNDTTDTRPVEMGHQNSVNSSRFFDAATGRGNYWSRFDTPAEGCVDSDLDHRCDGSFFLDVGQLFAVQVFFAWTMQNGWANVRTCTAPDPHFISLDNTGAHGLFEGIVSNTSKNEKTAVSLTIAPTDVFFDVFTFSRRGIAIWFSIVDINFDPATASIQPDFSDVVGGDAANLRLIPPDGRASFVAQFCTPGNVTFRIGIDEKAAAVTIADLIAPLSAIIDFTSELLEIPLYNSAVTHYVNAWQITPGNSVITESREAAREIAFAARDLVRLAANRAQRAQLRQTFLALGIDVTIDKILKSAADLVRISADLNTFVLATGGTFETTSDIILRAPR